MEVYMSSSCSSKRALPEVLGEMVSLGFRNIELTGNIEYSEGICEDILRLGEKYEIDYIMHNYFPFHPEELVLNLASRKPDVKEKTLRHMRDTVSLLRKLGKNLYSVHPGYRKDLAPTLKDGFFISTDDELNYREDFYQTVDMVLRSVFTDGFKMAVENLHPKGPSELYSFLCTPSDIEDFLEYFHNRPNVGILLDLGHFNVTSCMLGFNKLDALDRLFGDRMHRIFAFHVSENDCHEDSHLVSDPESWQIQYLYENRRYLRGVPVTMEWHNSASKDTFKRYLAIKEKLES